MINKLLEFNITPAEPGIKSKVSLTSYPMDPLMVTPLLPCPVQSKRRWRPSGSSSRKRHPRNPTEHRRRETDRSRKSCPYYGTQGLGWLEGYD